MSTTASAPSHYDVLGVSPSCSQEQIKRAYHTAALKNHPDKASSTGCAADTLEFQSAHNAYQVLRDVESRKRYDQSLAEATLRSQLRISDEVSLDAFSFDADDALYTLVCRCGEHYVLTVDEVEDFVDTVPCEGCSLVIRVEYKSQGDAN
ncbi:hypothetical protein H310_01235 [Aphanomyces invadans]|uniref:Diphthamide biosynthesis protein 4 n=1 Tax=Aphanomyces invadans TaxID=157072 RepID=A0A024UQY1_9STRA|nr:hypothetical protein H310_01235 [Aphanomyces invadans]ETW08709.1 hypothetical protein H310_01235 [Aphanomyces invadans]|eukprot:XP_008862514.1 hypothetical protein H310_01235 [Aphanomyces invadans]